jgi:hypothetical protein
MEQSPFSEANSHSASQEILRLLWNPKDHFRIHKHPPLVPMLRHEFSPQFPTLFPIRSILILSSHLTLCIRSGLFPSVFPTKCSYAFLVCPMCSTFPAHLIFSHLITLIMHNRNTFESRTTSTNSMEQSPSWEANSHSASQVPRLLRNPKVHYRVHNSPPLVPVLIQMQPAHSFHPTSPGSILHTRQSSSHKT